MPHILEARAQALKPTRQPLILKTTENQSCPIPGGYTLPNGTNHPQQDTQTQICIHEDQAKEIVETLPDDFDPETSPDFHFYRKCYGAEDWDIYDERAMMDDEERHFARLTWRQK
jgi:hypothetical protein